MAEKAWISRFVPFLPLKLNYCADKAQEEVDIGRHGAPMGPEDNPTEEHVESGTRTGAAGTVLEEPQASGSPSGTTTSPGSTSRASGSGPASGSATRSSQERRERKSFTAPPPPETTPSQRRANAFRRLTGQQGGLSRTKREALEGVVRALELSGLRISLIVPDTERDGAGQGEIELSDIVSTFHPPLISRTLSQAYNGMELVNRALGRYFNAVADETLSVPREERPDPRQALGPLLAALSMSAARAGQGGPRQMSFEDLLEALGEDGPDIDCGHPECNRHTRN